VHHNQQKSLHETVFRRIGKQPASILMNPAP
jgi:hypothetical protein